MKVLRNSRVPLAVGAAALLPCAFFGSTALVTWIAAHAAWLTLPTALGAPFAVPRLSLVPFGERPGATVAVELLAVVVLAVVAAAWTARALRRRPDPGPWRSSASGWWAFTVGLAAANVPRALVPAWEMGLGPLGWYGMLLGGLLAALLWGLLLGWVCVLPRLLLRAPTPLPAREP
ncbi:hypothetical protein IDM40_20095 [Nocardiopsis sp. HNM0947]|uniref:Uncharacterized protein n=1 Tax=Nocardiopsis coralli TaxID=2772213 RepID=A0ABR9PAX2_9ACTN|nr:hypothetical protein [Nocardiopsis coralli]MBE3000977.1 hypothetical protein [Nocardiopsis coralli]